MMQSKTAKDFTMDPVIGLEEGMLLPEDDYYLGERYDISQYLCHLGSRGERLYEQAVRLHAGHFDSENEKANLLEEVQEHFLSQAEKLGDFFAFLNEGFAIRKKDRDRLDIIRVRLEKIRGLIAYQTNDLESLQDVDLAQIEAKRFRDREERTQKLQVFLKNQKTTVPETTLDSESLEKLQDFERAQFLLEKRQQEMVKAQLAWSDTKNEIKKWFLILTFCLIPLSYFFIGRISPNEKIQVDPVPYQQAMNFRAIYQKKDTLMIVVENDWGSLYTREKETQLRKISKISPDKILIVVDPDESLLADFKHGTLHVY